MLGLVAAICVLALSAFGLRSQRSTGAGEAQSGESAELRALRAETRRLRDAVAALERAQEDARVAAQQPPAALPQEMPAQLTAAAQQQGLAAEPGPAPSEAEQREDALRYANYLDGELERSLDDGDLAASLGAKVKDFLDDGSALIDVQCGRELCRVKTRHDDMDAYRAFQTNAFTLDERLWSGPITIALLEEPAVPGGPLVAGVYLGRGAALPSPEPGR